MGIAGKDIALLELVAFALLVTVSAALFGDSLEHLIVSGGSDNSTVLHWLNRGFARLAAVQERHANDILKFVWHLTAVARFSFQLSWMPSAENTLSDAPSRNDVVHNTESVSRYNSDTFSCRASPAWWPRGVPFCCGALVFATCDASSPLGALVWELKTGQAYSGYHKKWLSFCKAFGVSSTEPSSSSLIAFAAWLVTVGAWAESKKDFVGSPMSFSSVKQYVEHVTRALKAFHSQNLSYVNPGQSLPVHWAMMAIKRKLGNAKQRARTVSVDELRSAIVNCTGSDSYRATFKFIALLAWLGAFRLGQLLPNGLGMLSTTMKLSHLRLDADHRSLLVEVHRSKTNLFKERFRLIRIMGSADVHLCIVRAFSADGQTQHPSRGSCQSAMGRGIAKR